MRGSQIHTEGRERCAKKGSAGEDSSDHMWGTGGERWEQNREEEDQRREQSKGKRCMQHCLIHPFFSHSVLSAKFSSFILVPLCVRSFSFRCHAVSFSMKCKSTERCTFFVRAVKFQRSACVCISASLTADYSSVSRVTEQKKPSLNTDWLLLPQVRSWPRGWRPSWV